jgi:pyrroline-5-carboxylate reductase
MGGALLRGWLAMGFAPGGIVAFDPKPSSEMDTFLRVKGVRRTLDEAPSIIVLAVKPQIVDAVLGEVARLADADTAILSIAAGRTIASLEKHFAQAPAVVRAMPNLPAEIGCGISVACANRHTSEAQRTACGGLLSAAGEVDWIEDESLMDAVSAVSGSGPAYVFHLVECLADAARAEGLAPELAMKLARATVTGSAALLARSPLGAAELRENVTSPGGTTAAALEVLMAEPGLRGLMARAVEAAARRSRELAAPDSRSI